MRNYKDILNKRIQNKKREITEQEFLNSEKQEQELENIEHEDKNSN